MTVTYQDLMFIQQTNATVSPTELVELLRESGRRVSRRTLSFWQSQGLIPAAERTGARGGTLPYAVLPLAAFVADGRERGWSIETIKELLPLWRHLAQAEANEYVSLTQFERVARSLELSLEAAYQVPSLMHHSMTLLCGDCLGAIRWELKNGSVTTARDGLQLRFALAEVNPNDGFGDIVNWTQLTIPGIDEHVRPDDPTLIVLGIPNGIELRNTCEHSNSATARRRGMRAECQIRQPRRHTRPPGEEVKQLELT